VPAADADNQAMTLMGRIAKMYDATSHGGRRLEVQLVLRNQTTLWMIQNVDLRSDLNERLDVYPFTMEDQWAKTVLTGSRREGNHCYPLDRKPIDRDSNQTVHLVVIGNGALAESLAITAALTAGATVSISKIVSIAKRTSAKNQIGQYSAALQSYFLDCGRFPTTEQGLAALWEKPVLYPVPEEWSGPYIDREPGNDPWGTDFEYLSSESSIMPSEVPEGLPYVLISYGADKKEGGKGDASDIYSWK
jgi:general secretion pathway protein G